MAKLALLSALALITVATAAAPAAAEPAPESAADPARSARAAELNEAGARLYRERNYRQAIEKFIEAHAIDRDPNLVFNMARCYEELGDTGAAIEKYTTYVNAPGADAAGRLRAEQSLRALVELQKRPRADAKSGPGKTGGISAAGARVTPDEAPAPVEASSRRLTLAWSALGAGVLLAGLGATGLYLGVRDHERVTGAPGYGDPGGVHAMTLPEARELVESGDRKKLAGGIGLALGGALIATSVTLFLWPTSDEKKDRGTVAFGWLPGAGGFRAAWTVRF